ncbi:DUF2189 domain-containing protein [Thauera linaloolentis]|uniref:DUF2189 domain-containing protein n=1 Tax=Thauera linaloolentis (strain DSM 12138 / JCM 21573 / CCUG 41526 / CIP 105981 / IAM 15112 / NBRC 102519 / 47Lol) TaxID=1123367 RepID=N6ZDF2_THAL4|nr:DUF2189 domain-containing protein [Thauera linaloolentis]ENO90204.1 hypothetical protein C666_03060 [Thauera linaloolentis 47Lol = DSM 12138]MCM8564659.1 DUF2189 domain-containing protein [Thauera linaloolentis]
MAQQNDPPPVSGPGQPDPAPPFPGVRDVPLGAPLRWIALGAGDLKACAIPSLFYGFCFTGMGLLLTVAFRHAYEYVFALTSGFLILGPFLAMGLYEISRRRQRGEACELLPTLTVWRRNAGNIGVFAVVLGIVFLVWARASLIVFALFYTGEMPDLSDFIGQVLSLENLEFLAAYFGVGLVFAFIAFAASVVAVPLMLDRNQDAISSMLASFSALLRNPGTMLVWAVLIVSLTLLGFLTFHVGLVVMMPIIGHATWHAYRDLVEPQGPPG